jgi:uncharacterized protein with HEPN domain
MLPDADVVRLQHMLDAALEAMEFAENRSRDDLATDRMLSRAIVHDIELVGEAASRVSPQTQEEYPAVPWASIIGMRNRLIHGYFDIDLDRVWDTVSDDLPPLVAQLRVIVKGLGENGE